MTRVAITGIGLIAPEHDNAGSLFQTLSQKKSTISFDAALEKLGVTQVPSGALSSEQKLALEDYMYTKLARRQEKCHLASTMLFYSATQALMEAGLDPSRLSRNTELHIGINKLFPSIANVRQRFKQKDLGLDSALNLSDLNPSSCVQPLLQYLQYQGPVSVHSDACAAAAASYVSAFRRIRSGIVDVAVCGSTEHGTDPLMQMLFKQVGALFQGKVDEASQACRAFDKTRQGCVLADASATVILESETHAKQRGAKILAYVEGVSRYSEAYKITFSTPSGELYANYMNMALEDAKVNASQIDHINAHGTGTVKNDESESRAIHTLFHSGPTSGPSVVSTKSALGHSLAASGAIELSLCVESLKKQQVLPSINYQEPRADEPTLNILTETKKQDVNYILSNSFGFGGESSSIVLSREGL